MARGDGRGTGIFFEVEDRLLRRFRRWFTKNSLGKVWRNGKKQYFCGPVRRERGRARGGGSRGEKKNFSKNFSRKVWRFGKKVYFCTPERKRGEGDRSGRGAGCRGEAEAGAGARADAERRVH